MTRDGAVFSSYYSLNGKYGVVLGVSFTSHMASKMHKACLVLELSKLSSASTS